MCLRFLLSPHWPRTVQLFRDCSLLAVTGGAQKSPQTGQMGELVAAVEWGGKGEQKLKIVASRAEEEDAPGTWRERWRVLRGAETEASGLGLPRSSWACSRSSWSICSSEHRAFPVQLCSPSAQEDPGGGGIGFFHSLDSLRSLESPKVPFLMQCQMDNGSGGSQVLRGSHLFTTVMSYCLNSE